MSSPVATSIGPVSAELLGQVAEHVRKHNIVVWLDRAEHYNELVDRVRAGDVAFPFPVFAFRESFLELMLDLESVGDGARPEPFVVHMPGFTEDDMKTSPVFELYRAGIRFRAALDTLAREAATGRVVPSAIEVRLAQGFASLAEADEWLQRAISRETRDDIGAELGLGKPVRVFDDLGHGALAARANEPAVEKAITAHLERTLGLDAKWRKRVVVTASEPAERFRLWIATWALSVEFANDLQREPLDEKLAPLRTLPKKMQAACRDVAEHLRQTDEQAYTRYAQLLEDDLADEVRETAADHLGTIDTLRFEDRVVFSAAMDALESEAWERARDYAHERTPEKSFWVRTDRARRTGWHLVRAAAELGIACSGHDEMLKDVSDLTEAADRYARGGFKVDRLQRQFEQARGQLALVQLDEAPRLRKCLDHVRRTYRAWADGQAVRFNAICNQRGFLPEPAQRQRTLFDDLVRPSTEQGRTAYFVVDALRYEMADELRGMLGAESGPNVALAPRYAELPTLTEVGMTVLAPVVRDGRLEPEIGSAIKGFRAGSKRVATPADRQQAMHDRVGGETCPWLELEHVLDRDDTSLKRSIARARLIVVHSDGLDKAGERGVGLRHFEDELQRVRAAWARLRDLDVERFVLTADHGFLLQDSTTREPLKRGKRTDPKRRHVIERNAVVHEGEVGVSSTELDYIGDPVHFVFPETTAPFDIGAKTKDFLHGGNSLQERVIPVLTATYRRKKGGGGSCYVVQAEVQPPVMGMHRLKVTVEHGPDELAYGADEEVELRLQAIERDVSIELLDAPGARRVGGAVVATVTKAFELVFRLSADHAKRTQVQVRGAIGDQVGSVTLERWFAVEGVAPDSGAVAGEPAAPASAEPDTTSWLAEYDDERVRAVFAHLADHGAINEEDATRLLGNARRFRRFSANVDTHAEKAPFDVRIDTTGGQKRYVREGDPRC